jgi:hypothetical protein
MPWDSVRIVSYQRGAKFRRGCNSNLDLLLVKIPSTISYRVC